MKNPASMAGITAGYTDRVTLPENDYERTGFVFLGWSFDADDVRKLYPENPAYEEGYTAPMQPGDIIANVTTESSITVYPVWKEASYGIHFHANDAGNAHTPENAPEAEGSMADIQKVYYTEEVVLPENTYTRTGFTWKGWSIEETGNDVVYTDQQKLSRLAEKDGKKVGLYAAWKEHRYQIKFHANDAEETAHGSANVTAEGSMETLDGIYYTEKRTLPANGFSRNGFTFLGWSTEEHKNEAVYKDQMDVRGLTAEDGTAIDLYAAWAEHSYQIRFDPNDSYSYGTPETVKNPASMAGITAGYTDRVTLPENDYERTGFVFLGWSFDADDVRKLYPKNPAYEEGYTAPMQPGDTIANITTESSITVYPVWKEAAYGIHFHANNAGNAHTPENAPEAEGSMADIRKVYYTEEVTLPKNTYTRTGFTWKGWSIEEKGNGVVYTDQQKLSRLAEKDGTEVVLYAAWKEHSYQITFVPNDGRCYGSGDGTEAKVSNPDAMQPVTLYYTDDFILPECGYRRKGFTFLGYSLTDNTELLYLPAGREKTSLEETAEKMAERLRNTPEDIRAESAAPLSAGEVIHRISAEENGSVTLYPVWKEHRYQIKFHANDAEETAHGSANVTAEGSMETLDGIYYTEKRTLPANGFSRNGFTFLGWSTEEHKNEAVYEDTMEVRGLTAEDGTAIDLYAAWEEHSFQLHFDPNDSYCYGADDGVTAETVHADAMKEQDTTLYYTDVFVLPACGYGREGFTFLGWSFDADDVRKLYPEKAAYEESYAVPMQPGDTLTNITTESAITVYPVWKEAAYGIHFHAGGAGNGAEAEGSMEDIEKVYYTEKRSLPENVYARTGFTFLGWAAEEGSREVVYEDGETIGKETSADNAVLDLYAVWSEHSYQIRFDPNDGYSYGTMEKVTNPVSMAGIKANHTDKVALPENAYERNGFLFRGWTTDKEDGKKLYPENPEYDKNYQAPYQPGDVVSGLEDADGGVVTFYPVWEEISYRITFHANDKKNAHTPENEPEAEGSMEDIRKVYYTEEVVLPKNAYTRTGFTWKGWSVKEADNAVVYTDGQKLSRLTEKNGEKIDLYAAWREARYTISYDANDGYCYGAKDGIFAGVDREDAMKDSSVTLYYTDLYEIPSCGYQRDGFRFLGWTENSGDGKKLYPEDKEYDPNFRASWQPGDSVYGLSAEDGGEVILYPLWKEHKMTVRFDKNADDAVWQADGTRKEVYYTELWSVKEVPSRTGYQFFGYAQNKEAGQEDLQELKNVNKLAGSHADGETKTLYALWDANQLSVTYESEGVVSAHKESAVYGQSCTLADENMAGFSDLEKTFLGWSTKAMKGYGTKADVDYEAGAESRQCFGLADTDAETSLHLYAVWRENTYDVCFDVEGGTGKAPATMGGIRYTEEITLPQNESVKEGCTFKGWSFQAGADRADFQAGEAVSRLPECNRDGAAVTLHAVWSVTPPEITAQTETGDFGAEVKPGIPVTVSVSAIGLDLKYQWYRMEETTESAIEGADRSSYTIPAEDVTEQNDGTSYRCVIINEGGQTESRPFLLSVYGTPDMPAVSCSDRNERGWSSQDVRIMLSGSTVKGSTKQVRYTYSTDGSTWKDCSHGLAWKENTGTEGETLFFKAYNSDCPELESPVVTYTIRKDDEKPTITGIVSLAVTGSAVAVEDTPVTGSAAVIEDTDATGSAVVTGSMVTVENPAASAPVKVVTGEAVTACAVSGTMPAEASGWKTAVQTPAPAELSESAAYPVAVYAADHISGIFGYAVAGKGEEAMDWQESGRFELAAGTYRAYAMDLAGNVTYQEFTVYTGGYVLCSGACGSYTEGGSSHVVGEGTAVWDSPDMAKDKIESIVIEDGITEIPDGFFEGFTNLKELTIPDSVVIIGEHAFDGVPEDLVIHAPEGSEGEKAAEKHHYTEYDITIDGTTGSSIHVHYRDSVLLPEEGTETDGKTLVGWGTVPGEKAFGTEEAVSGLTGEMNGTITIYPVYTDAYMDEEGRLHITGNDTAYLEDILPEKDKITEIIIEEGVTVLPEQIPDGFKNLTDLTLPESLREIPEGKLDGMPEGSVIHAPEGSAAAEEAEKNHRTEYDIFLDGTEEPLHVHYQDTITLPETAPEKEGYVFIGWGTTPDRKEFEPGQTVSGLTGTPDGKVTLYPVYEKETAETPEDAKDPENPEEAKPEEPEENSSTGNGGGGSGNYLPSVPETMPEEPEKEHGVEPSGQEEEGREEQAGQEKEENDGTKEDAEGQNGFYLSGGVEYSSLEEVLESLEEQNPSGSQDGEKTEVHACGNSRLEHTLDIPETVRLVVNESLVIDGDITLSGGDMVILPGAEAVIHGSLTADADSSIYIYGTLTVHGTLITAGRLLIGENGILHVAPDGTCRLLPEADLENMGTVDGSIEQTEETEKGSNTITIKTKLPSIVIERGSTCTVKPVKGVTRWTVKNKKIASLKKKDGKLILTGKKNGKTVLTGKKNGKTYRYVIRVKKKEYNHQVKLAVVGKKSTKRTLTAGTIVKDVTVKNAGGKITLKLLWAGKNVKWKLSGDGTLKKKGKKAVVTMGSGSCTVTATYQGKKYQCELYR